jgi:hypothetical protein
MQPSPAAIHSDADKKEYTVERLTSDRLKDVEQLYKAVYKREAPVEYFIKKYNTGYTGVEYVGYVAYNPAGSPIGYYGVIPCFLKCGGEKILAAQSADTMTHPGFRYKGLFVHLSNITFDLCRQSGVRVIFGFPNQNSYHGAVNKLGWQLTHTMECFLLPVKSNRIKKYLAKLPMTSGLQKQQRERVLSSYRTNKKMVANSVLADAFFGVVRDLNYQTSKDYHHREVLKMENCQVWCKITDEFIIGDMEITPGQFLPLLEKIIDVAGKLGLKQIQFHASPGTGMHTLFAANYSSIPSFAALFQNFDPTININHIRFTFADIDIF